MAKVDAPESEFTEDAFINDEIICKLQAAKLVAERGRSPKLRIWVRSGLFLSVFNNRNISISEPGRHFSGRNFTTPLGVHSQ